MGNSLLADGRACILVDGVDELSVERLPEVGRWLSTLVESFPDVRYVVTSRPTGISPNWLQDMAFQNAILQPMTESDIHEFVTRWYQTAAMERGDESLRYDFDLFQRQLVNAISTSRQLRELATSPLLCALLCALHLRSRAHLPVDKIQIYETAIEMLLERRDAERGILTYRVRLSQGEKLFILRDLAYWLMRNERTYIGRDQAIKRIGGVTHSFHGKARPDTVLEDLLQRAASSTFRLAVMSALFTRFSKNIWQPGRPYLGMILTS